MATNKQLKFFKGANAPAAPAAGMIWFCTTDRTIRVYTGTEWEKYSGLVNAEWVAADKKLNITSANGTVTTLDLSDCASASDISSKLTTINNTLTSHDTRITTAQSAAEAAQAAAEAADAKAVQEAKDRASEITRVEGLISAEATTARAAEQANAKAASDAAALGQKGINDAAAAAAAVETEKGRAEGVEKGLDDRLKLVEGAVGDGGSVSDAINAAIEALATPEAGVKGDGTHVDVTVKQVDGVITEVVVDESDIASAQALADEISDRAVDEQAIIDRIALLDTATTGRVSVLEGKVDALSSATHFVGVKGELPASGADGDIVIVGNKEYIYDSTQDPKWIELGDTTAESGRITALEGLVGSTSVDAQIDAKIGALNATVGEASVATGKHVAVQVVEAEGVLTALTVSENDIASAAKLSEIEGEVDLNTAAVANYKTRIEALEETKNALDSTYVKVSAYNTDKEAFEKKHTDLQGEIDTAEGRLDTAEADIDNLQAGTGLGTSNKPTYTGANYISTANTMVAAELALDSAIKALDTRVKAEEDKTYVSSVTGDADIAATTTNNNVALSLNKATSVTEGNTQAVTSGAVFDALCWVEFE